MRNLIYAFAILVGGASDFAAAQPARPGAPAGPAPEGADQVVGLFSATCLNFAGDVAALRSFLSEQHAPQMPPAARDAFLSGRHGQVFDVSFQTVKLAMVSLDDGGCEAVAEQAASSRVVAVLNQAAQENHVTLQAEPAPAAAPPHPGVQQTAYALTLAGHPMHILVATETPTPQAILTLVPR